MAYDDDERSTSSNRPIELFTITTPTQTYRLTSHYRDVTYGGQTFTALTMDRGPQAVSQEMTGRELIVYLPITHPLIQRFAASGIPEASVLVTLSRLQQVSGEALQAWQGWASGISIEGHVAQIRVPSITDDAMRIQLPVIAAQRICNHVLYDVMCHVQRTDYQVNTTIASLSGATVTVASMAGEPDGWASFGEIVDAISQERRNILRQVGTTLTLDMPLTASVVGSNVAVYAGCEHDVTTCHEKFDNVAQFGGMPEMNGQWAPWSPGAGLGVIQQP